MTDDFRAVAGFEQATVYLAEPDVGSFEDCLRDGPDDRPPLRVGLRADLQLDGVIYVARYATQDPGWKRALASLAADPLVSIATMQAGAVLFLRLAGRIFAFAFGQGRHLLDSDRFVDDFGVRVAANQVDPRFIRAVDGRSFERGIILTRRQISRPDRVEALGVQIDREFFTAITGRSRRPGEGRIHGSTSLGVAREMPFDQLDALATEWLAAYGAADYREAFPTLDRMRPMSQKDPLVGRLTELLVRDLSAPSPSAYLAPPALLAWEEVSAFRLSTLPGSDLDEPDLADYLDSIKGPPTASRLDEDEVRIVARDSPKITSRLPVRRWLVWETVIDGIAFVLFDGRWYRVAESYVESVNEVVGRIKQPSIALAPPSAAMDEGKYNIELAAALPGILLDKKLARVQTASGGFELCDVFAPPTHLIHVKRGLGSQDLTYLFSQGVQAAEGLRRSRQVRERLIELVSKENGAAAAALPLDRRPNREELEVVYAVVTEVPERVPNKIPFFARAALARAVRSLDDMDFAVSVAGVKAPASKKNGRA